MLDQVLGVTIAACLLLVAFLYKDTKALGDPKRILLIGMLSFFGDVGYLFFIVDSMNEFYEYLMFVKQDRIVSTLYFVSLPLIVYGFRGVLSQILNGCYKNKVSG